MKNIFKLSFRISFIIALSFLLSNCANNDVSKKSDKKIPKEALDCCPGGGGILDYSFHYDKLHATDSTREGSPFVVFNVNGRDILFFSTARKIEDHKNVTKQGDIFYSTRPVAERDECWNKNWSEPKEIITGDTEFDSWTKGTLSIFGSKAIISSEKSLNKEIPGKTLGTSYNLDLWELDFKDGQFSNPVRLPDNVNSDYWDTYPAYSPDGKILYFVSNRPWGEAKTPGDFNIWCSVKNENSWSDAVMVSTLSSASNEVTPFWGSDGKFYFATDKSGNYDIFVCSEFEEVNGMKFPTNPQNINDYLKNDRNTKEKYEINTSADEINPYVTPDCSGLFYSSTKIGGQRDYDLFACKLPPPLYRLKVNVYESVSLCGQKERRPYDDLELCIDDGKTKKKFFAREIINLLPNRNYVVNICDDTYEKCYNASVIGNKKIEINTATQCDKNKLFTETLEIESSPVTDNFSVGADNFVTGYWKPSTTENIKELAKRAEDGFFDNKQFPAPFVRYNDPPDNTLLVDKSFMEITERISSYIKKYYNCLKNGIYQLRINIKGYTDRQRIRGGKYPDISFKNANRDWTIEQGEAMKDIQRGNIILSKMRAYHTYMTIENMMSSYPQYNELKSNIKYDFEGMGVDFDSYRGKCRKDDCSEARRMEVTIDLGPECWLDQNRRIPARVSYLPLLDKDDKDKNGGMVNYSLIQPFPKKDIPKKECDEFYAEYFFKTKEEAQFVNDILVKFSDVKFTMLADTNSKGEPVFKLRTNEMKSNKSDALNEIYKAKDAISSAESILKKSSPDLKAEGCQTYIISFGIFVSQDLAKDFIEKLDELDIKNLQIRECNDCFQTKNFSTGEDEFVKSFMVLAPGFESRERAEKQMNRWSGLLNQYEILNYMRIENELWDFKKNE